jgi:hypothetical protein
MSTATLTPPAEKTAPFAYEGSVSHATMRTWDLLNAFIGPLAELGGEDDKALVMETREMLSHGEYSVEYGDHAEDASGLLDTLFDALDSLSPDGMYFGATEGDGSDYGFWPLLDDYGHDDE